MIGYLKGRLIGVSHRQIILDVRDVGYELQVTDKWLSDHGHKIGQEHAFFIHTAAKDNEISLIGLATLAEKDFFHRLLKVPSVGPKTALKILSAYPVSEIETAVENQNIDLFLKIKGLAKKTAQKVIIELRSQFKALAREKEQSHRTELTTLTAALRSMGFLPAEIQPILKHINKNDSLDQQVKQALTRLST